MELKNKIELLFLGSGGIMTTSELKQKGISQYYIKKMVEDGMIEPLKRGIYKLTKSDLDGIVEASKIVSKGIICMFSAATIYNLTTIVPSEYHIAIPKKDKIILPSYPPIKIYYWSNFLLELGLQEIDKDGHTMRIYDLEKTVCDFLKFKNKIGFDTAKEVLISYLRRDDRNISKLVRYAKKLRIHSIIDQYLKVLL